MPDLAAAITLLSSDGPHIGLHLNLDKCVLWGPAAQGTLPPTLHQLTRIPWASNTGITVLGLPVSFPTDTMHTASHLSSLVDKLEHACHLISSLGNPHYQHLLLRYCADACRLIHFIRGVTCADSDSLLPLLGRASAAIRRCLEDTIGAGALDDDKWAQCCLPLRAGGLGLKDPSLLIDCARIAASLRFPDGARALAFPPAASAYPPDLNRTVARLRNSIDPAFGPLQQWYDTTTGSLILPLQGLDTQHR